MAGRSLNSSWETSFSPNKEANSLEEISLKTKKHIIATRARAIWVKREGMIKGRVVFDLELNKCEVRFIIL